MAMEPNITINVGIAKINHPPVITINGWYKPSKKGGLLLLYPYYRLVGGLDFFLFFHILGIIIPIDELIFFRGVAQPPTRNSIDYAEISPGRHKEVAAQLLANGGVWMPSYRQKPPFLM